jgi:hypothetical protein
MAGVYPSATRTDHGVRLVFPYDIEMVEGVKAIPAHARTYSPESKVWTVRDPYIDRAIALLLKHFPHATVIGERARHSAPPPPPPPKPQYAAHSVLYLLPSAPPEVVDAAYRALVKLHHPDRLPEPEKAAGNTTLARINVAYAQLTAGRKIS